MNVLSGNGMVGKSKGKHFPHRQRGYHEAAYQDKIPRQDPTEARIAEIGVASHSSPRSGQASIGSLGFGADWLTVFDAENFPFGCIREQTR